MKMYGISVLETYRMYYRVEAESEQDARIKLSRDPSEYEEDGFDSVGWEIEEIWRAKNLEKDEKQ